MNIARPLIGVSGFDVSAIVAAATSEGLAEYEADTRRLVFAVRKAKHAERRAAYSLGIIWRRKQS